MNLPEPLARLRDRLWPPRPVEDVEPPSPPVQPPGLPAPPNLTDRIPASHVLDRAARTVRAGEPNEDAAESAPLEVERELEAVTTEVQAEVSKWAGWVVTLVAAEVPVLRDQGKDLVRRADDARTRCDELWGQRRQVENSMAIHEPSSFVAWVARGAFVVALILALFELPLIEPIISDITNMAPDDPMRWIGAFLIVSVQALVSFAAAVAAKEWQQSRAAARTRRWMLALAVAAGLATVGLAAGIVAMRYAQYHSDVTVANEAGGVLALATGLQAALVVCAVLAGWFGHSPMARELAGLVGQTFEADVDLAEIEAAAQQVEATADELEAFVTDLPTWLAHHRDAVRQQAVAIDHELRDRIKELLVGMPDAEIRIWKLDRIVRPSFPIPVLELDLGEHDLLVDDTQLALF